MDIAGLKKLQLQVRVFTNGMCTPFHFCQSIINLCIALGFLAHGYATAEFEVTVDRLGCYLPVRIQNAHCPYMTAQSRCRQNTSTTLRAMEKVKTHGNTMRASVE